MNQPTTGVDETNSEWFASALDSALDSDQVEELDQEEDEITESEDN